MSEGPPYSKKGARRDRERAQRARALKGETLSTKFLETAFSLKGFGFRDGKTPGSGICRNRSGRPRHKSCLPRRTVLVVLRVPARAPLGFRLWSASLELVVVSRVLSRRPPLRTQNWPRPGYTEIRTAEGEGPPTVNTTTDSFL